MANIKCEQFNAYTLPFCGGCLSTERVLTPLNENENVFQTICSNFVFQTEILLCWECTAILTKMRTFQRQVENAQRMLHFYYMEKQEPPKCLSNLKTTAICDIKATNIEELVEVKKELEEYKEHINTEDICNEDCVEDIPDIKEEVNEDVKLIRKPKTLKYTKHYKFILEDQDPKNAMGRTWVTQSELTEHLERARRSQEYMKSKYKCERCVCYWNDEKKKKWHHKRYHKKSGPYSCDICHRKFINKQSLMPHVRGHYLLFKCSICGLISHVRKEMNRHIYTHKKSVQCLVCHCIFSTLEIYRKHYKALHKTFICDDCGRRCKTKRSLINHVRHHADIHKCNICSKTFKTYERLRRHETMLHTITRDENSYCVLCDKQFNNKNIYRRHVRSSTAHAQEWKSKKRVRAKIPCPECGNIYSRKSYMMNHYRYVHMNQSKYYCEDCDKHFLNRTRYVEHMKYQHEGATKEKNKLCNVCGRGFAATRTLINHIRTHSGEKPHECTYCDAKFIQKHAMVSHIKYVHLKLKRRSGWHES